MAVHYYLSKKIDRKTLCPAVLTENFFMDGLDLEFLQSRAGKQAVVGTHVEGIIEYLSL